MPRREALWRVIEGIGGENGWYSFPLAWAVRGWLDRLVGGVGLRRGRRDAEPAAGRRLAGLLARGGDRAGPAAAAARRDAAARPGLAGDVRSSRTTTGRTRYRQRALFHPRGLAGHAYWWSVSPFHAVVFGGMARNIAQAAAKGMSAHDKAAPEHRIREATSGGSVSS